MYKQLGILYKGLKKKLKDPKFATLKEVIKNRLIEWRRSKESIIKLEKPIRLDKARKYGYKAKKGFVVAICRIRKGGRHAPRPSGGRKPTGYAKLTPVKSIQRIAEERVQRKFMNLEVLASYLLYQDGQHKYFEVILVDKHRPEIKNDKDINWICEKQHKHRVFRGLTPAGKKQRKNRKK